METKPLQSLSMTLKERFQKIFMKFIDSVVWCLLAPLMVYWTSYQALNRLNMYQPILEAPQVPYKVA
jgi:hypothetical protein